MGISYSLVSQRVLALLCLAFFEPVDSEMDDGGRIRGHNGEISLMIAVPLTNNNVSLPDPGWVHLSSAIMAVDHFNRKDPSVVKELQRDFKDCNITLVNVSVVDTGTNSHNALKSIIWNQLIHGYHNPPDAIAGPYNEQPTLELSVLATGMEVPIVAYRGLNQDLILPDKHPYFSQVNPDIYGTMEILGEYLQHTGRTNYIAVLYSSDDNILQRVEILKVVLKENYDIDQIKAFGYQTRSKSPENETGDRGIRDALWSIKQTGFRTIVYMTEHPEIDFKIVGPTAREFELDQGEHFWVGSGGLDPSSVQKEEILVNLRENPDGGYLRGSAFLQPLDGFHVNLDDKFGKAFRAQNASAVQRIVDMIPIPNYFANTDRMIDFYPLNSNQISSTNNTPLSPDTLFPPDDVFQNISYIPERTSFIFDAVMSIGIGACLATANKTDSLMTGEEHLQGIRSVNVSGASGNIRYGGRSGTPGSRASQSAYFGVINLLPFGGRDVLLASTEYKDPFAGSWVKNKNAPFIYADGTLSPPVLLRTTPEQNYLSLGAHAFGLALMSLVLFAVVVSLTWTLIYRNHSVVIASQPPFLYSLFLGSTITSFAIFFSSFDESFDWSDQMLDAACVAIPWLCSIGHIITYSALFTKLWRVNKVLHFRNARVKVRHVMWPALLLIITAAVILAVWTAVSDFGWYRTETNALSGESIGRCQGSDTLYYLIPVGVLCIIPTLLTAIMAYKTADIDDLYSESKWIYTLILVHIQVIFVGVPIVVILQNVSVDGRLVGLSLLLFSFPASTLDIIMIPNSSQSTVHSAVVPKTKPDSHP